MGIEINLLKNYPKTKRNIKDRGADKTEEDRKVARRFGKDFFDGDRKHGYGGFRYSPKFWQPVIPAFQQHFSLSAHSSVLDVGCGSGEYMLTVAKMGAHVFGQDLGRTQVNAANNRLKKHQASGRAFVGDAQKLSFESNYFDIVYSTDFFEHICLETKQKVISEIYRVLKPGGHLVIKTPNLQYLKLIININDL